MLSHTIPTCIDVHTYPNDYWNKYITGSCTLPKHQEEASFPEYENVNLKAARRIKSPGGCWLFPIMALARVAHCMVLLMIDYKVLSLFIDTYCIWMVENLGKTKEKRFTCHISYNTNSFKFFFLYNVLYLWDSEGVGVWGNEMRKGLGKRIVKSSGLDETKKF